MAYSSARSGTLLGVLGGIVRRARWHRQRPRKKKSDRPDSRVDHFPGELRNTGAFGITARQVAIGEERDEIYSERERKTSYLVNGERPADV